MAYDDDILADNPTRYWRLAEAVSSTQVVDETGNIAAADTVITNAVCGTASILPRGDDPDTCIDFDGTGDWIVIEDATNDTSFSVECWIRPDVSPVSLGIFARTASGTPVGGGHMMDCFITAGGVVAVRVFDGSGQVTTGTTVIQNGEVYHIVVTVSNSGSLRLYINGVEEGTADTVGTMEVGQSHWWIGVESQNNSLMQGKISKFAVYGEVLGDATILAHHTSGITADGGGDTDAILIGGDLIHSQLFGRLVA